MEAWIGLLKNAVKNKKNYTSFQDKGKDKRQKTKAVSKNKNIEWLREGWGGGYLFC